MPYPDSMVQLIDEFAKMPGVGRRTAERFAMYILSASPESVEALSELVLRVHKNIHACQVCYNLSEAPICHICANPARDHGLICVVQDPKDVIAVEKAGDYTGIYHVLMGSLSPLDGIGPKDLRIKELLDRLKSGTVKEVVIGTSSDTEGDATSAYLMKQIKELKTVSAKGTTPFGGKVTRIAHGVPVGSALEFVDKATLSRAFRHRQEI